MQCCVYYGNWATKLIKMEILKKLTTEQLKKMLTEIGDYATECFIRAELLNRGEL